MSNVTLPRLFTTEDIAKAMQVSNETVRRAVRAKEIIPIGGAPYRFTEQEAQRWMGLSAQPDPQPEGE